MCWFCRGERSEFGWRGVGRVMIALSRPDRVQSCTSGPSERMCLLGLCLFLLGSSLKGLREIFYIHT